MSLVPGAQNRAVPSGGVGEVHALLLGDEVHHPHDLLQNRQNVHRRRGLQHAAVQPGQAEEVLRDAGEALRLPADVGDKLLGGFRVDVLRLQNGVRQKADGRQGGFQLVGRVGDKAAAGVLRGLEAVRQAVELVADLGDLVPAPDVRPVAVGSLPHLADGGEEQADLMGQGLGENQAQHQHQPPRHGGEAQQRVLKPQEQGGLLRVVLIGVDRADHLVLIHDGRGGPAAEGPLPEGAAKRVIAQQRLDDLRVKGHASHGGAGLPCVVEHPARAVGDQDAGEARLLRHGHGVRHVLLRQGGEAGKGVHHDGDAALEVGGLGVEDQVLGHQKGIGVQQQQHRQNDGDVAQADAELQAAPAGAFTP